MNADIFPAVSEFIPKVINTFIFILKSMLVFQRTFPCYKWIKSDNKKVTSYCIFNCDDSNTDLEDITKTILYHFYLKHSLNGCSNFCKNFYCAGRLGVNKVATS